MLGALRESIELALEVEGPAGGPLTREHLAEAVSYYALRYSAFPPGHLAGEVHRTRSLVGAMLRQPQDEAGRAELRLLAGWLSALVGNLPSISATIRQPRSTSAPPPGWAPPSGTLP